MTKAKLKNREVEYLEWNDNLAEMKRFCPNCTITYETCSIDDYFLPKIYDTFKEAEVIVPLKTYVIKLDTDIYISLSQATFYKYFETIENE